MLWHDKIRAGLYAVAAVMVAAGTVAIGPSAPAAQVPHVRTNIVNPLDQDPNGEWLEQRERRADHDKVIQSDNRIAELERRLDEHVREGESLPQRTVRLEATVSEIVWWMRAIGSGFVLAAVAQLWRVITRQRISVEGLEREQDEDFEE